MPSQDKTPIYTYTFLLENHGKLVRNMQCGAPFTIAKLVQITLITMVYDIFPIVRSIYN